MNHGRTRVGGVGAVCASRHRDLRRWAVVAAFSGLGLLGPSDAPCAFAGEAAAAGIEWAQPDPGGGARLSMNFQGIEVRAALQLLADAVGVDLVVSDTVTGSLTLRLKDLHWEQALEVIMQTKGLGARRVGPVLLIAPREDWSRREQQEHEQMRKVLDAEPLRTEVFQLQYSRAEEVARGLQGSPIGSSAAGVAPAGRSGGPVAMPSAGSAHHPSTGSAAVTVAGSASAGASGRLLSARGSAIPVLRTNQLFVTDVPGRLEHVKRLIAQIDIPVRQVLIEARIVQAHDAFGRTLGARLATGDAVAPAGPTTSAVSGAANGSSNARGRSMSLGLGLPAPLLQGADPPLQALALLTAASGARLSVELAALEEQGQGRVISRPRLITLDQVEAHVKQGFRVPYRGSASSLAGAGVQFQEANLKLAVTPHLTPEGKVMLDVLINKDSLAGITPDGREISTREVRTQVVVEDGGTVVLGGIYEEEQTDTRGRVPLLGDLPGIGALFRRSGQDSRRTELLIFITPMILKESLLAAP